MSVVTTCGSGVTAALLVFALAVLGKEDVALYDGSWAESGGRDDLPVGTGAGVSNRTVETVVTYLSMEAPPQNLPSMPVGHRLALMKADRIPLPFYRYLYEQVGMNWLWFQRRFLDDASLARKVHQDGIEIFVLYGNGAPAGFYELDFKKPEKTNLVYFGLVPEWNGRKVGPWLLGTAVLEAFSNDAKTTTVNTCTLDHPAALPLYQRLGFVPIARKERRVRVPSWVAIPDHIAAR